MFEVMTPPPIHKPHSSLNLVLFFLIPLSVFLVLVSILSPQLSSLSPLILTWRFRNSVSNYPSSSSSSLLIQDTPTYNSNVIKGLISNGSSSTYSSFLDSEPDYFSTQSSFSDHAFIDTETVRIILCFISLFWYKKF